MRRYISKLIALQILTMVVAIVLLLAVLLLDARRASGLDRGCYRHSFAAQADVD